VSAETHSGASSVTIPLSALRPDLANGWPIGSRWSIPAPGEDRSVEQPEGSVLSFRIRGATGARLRARVRLLTGDGSPSGAIRARVVLAGESRHEVWSGLLPTLRGHPVGELVDVDVNLDEPGEYALLLCASRLRPFGKGGARLRWEDPRIEVAVAPGAESAPTNGADDETGGPPPPEPDTPPAMATPLFSILTPVHNPPPHILEATLRSVREQRFQDWELRLVDDGSTDPEVMRILETARDEDDRIHLVRREKGGGISVATNVALTDAKGEYIALLDHDDVLTEDALETVAATIAADPAIDMVYSDEDVFDEDQRLAIFVKPSWSPDLMRSHMYTCHFGVYRRRLAQEIGGFRPKFDGSQDYDLVLRLSERTDRIVHIPQVLYHWRSHKGSVAENLAAKPHAFAAARRAIAEHLDRIGVEADVHFDALRCWYRVDYPTDEAASVALVLPLAEADDDTVAGLAQAVRAWTRIDDIDWELVLVGTQATLDRCESSLQAVDWSKRLRLVAVEAGVGRAAMLNRAAMETEADSFVILERPVEQLTSHWLRRLQSIAAQPDIGAVAAKALAVDGRVEHAGLVVSDGLPMPVQMAADQIEPGPMAILYVRGNFGSLSGTVATTRRSLQALGGFDERFDLLALPDYCLRAWESGLRVLSEPGVVVRRTDRVPVTNDLAELAAFAAHWRVRVPADPYYAGRAVAVLTGVGPAR
jgi:O-antigen biosynthesis protein